MYTPGQVKLLLYDCSHKLRLQDRLCVANLTLPESFWLGRGLPVGPCCSQLLSQAAAQCIKRLRGLLALWGNHLCLDVLGSSDCLCAHLNTATGGSLTTARLSESECVVCRSFMP